MLVYQSVAPFFFAFYWGTQPYSLQTKPHHHQPMDLFFGQVLIISKKKRITTLYKDSPTWMSQEFSKWLVNGL